VIMSAATASATVGTPLPDQTLSFLRSAACRPTFAAITLCPLLLRTRCST
jgi:hypothetical protein